MVQYYKFNSEENAIMISLPSGGSGPKVTVNQVSGIPVSGPSAAPVCVVCAQKAAGSGMLEFYHTQSLALQAMNAALADFEDVVDAAADALDKVWLSLTDAERDQLQEKP